MKRKSFARTILATIVSFEIVTILVVGYWLYSMVVKSMKDAFFERARLETLQIENMLAKRLDGVYRVAKELSMDNAVKISLMLGMESKLQDIVHIKDIIDDAVSFYVFNYASANIIPAPLVRYDQILSGLTRDFESFGLDSSGLNFFDTAGGKVFTFVEPVRRNMDLLGLIIAIYDPLRDRRNLDQINELWHKDVIYEHNGAFFNLFTGEEVGFSGNPKVKVGYEVKDFYCADDICLIPFRHIRYFYVKHSLDPLYKSMNNILGNLLVLCLLTFLIVLGGSLVLTRQFSATIRNFIRRIEIIALGRAGKLVNLQDVKYEEFHNIGIAFNTLLSDLMSAQAEIAENIQQKVDLLAMAIKQSDYGIIITDALWRVEYVNPAFEKIIGFPLEDIIGKSVNVLWDLAEEDNHLRSGIIEMLTKGNTWSGRISARRKDDGTSIVLYATAFYVRDKKGATSNYVISLKDITKMTELEKMVKHKQKMEALGTLAGGIAHDFNNIMTIILNATQMALASENDKALLREYLNTSIEAIYRAKEVVQQILAFSSSQMEDVREIVNISSVIKDAVVFLKSAGTAKIDIDVSFKEPDILIYGDPAQLYQMVINLASNAIYAMKDKGGTLGISLGSEVIKGEEATSLGVRVGKYATIEVSDEGLGIPPEIVDKIFDPYFTTKPAGEGSGLGLSVVHGIVQNLGGFIRVKTALGKGTTFKVVVPCFDFPEKEARQETLISSIPPYHGGLNILFVDDDQSIGHVIKKILEAYGNTVRVMNHPKEALDSIINNPQEYQLIISDFVMPGMNGLELIKQVRNNGINIPAIIVTAFAEDIPYDMLKLLKVKAVIKKPFSAKELVGWVRPEN